MIIVPPNPETGEAGSHVDHGLTEEQIAYLMAKFGHRDAFFIETVDLPPKLGTVPCGLHGPLMGDAPIADAETSGTLTRDSGGTARQIDRAPRDWHCVTLIAGPAGDEACVLYTAFGGPLTPKQPGDEDLTDRGERFASEAFWSMHALSSPEAEDLYKSRQGDRAVSS